MSTWNPHANEIFLNALELAEDGDRKAYLIEVCAGDADLRAEVESLLAAHEDSSRLFDSPAGSVTVAAAAVAELPGTKIGRYKLLEQIGEGGMGLVYMAEQTEPVRRRVALKIIKPGMDSRQIIGRFEAERQALAMMDHPNIARVIDGGTMEVKSGEWRVASEDGQKGNAKSAAASSLSTIHSPLSTTAGRPFFVMELVRGTPITEYCDEQRLTTRDRLQLFRQVCAAVQHAHQKGIIHRDIKPSNVLVASNDGVPTVKVIDFGIAKAIGQPLTDKTVFTHFVQFVGTPAYMSPEQAGQSSIDVDTRTDVYALGVLLYELLTGTTPLEKERLKAASFDEIRRIVREEEPPRPSTRMSTLNDQAGSTLSAQRQSNPRALSLLLRGELDWIVMKSLEKDRNRRYGSASDLEADIERFLKDQPVHACPPSRRYLLGKFIRRNRKNLLTASAFLAAALALIVVGGSWLWSRAVTVEAVESDWAEAESFWKEKQWAKAQPALERASGRLAGTGLTALQAKVDARRRDIEMVTRLDSALLQVMTDIQDSNARDFLGVANAYQTAFVEYGADVTAIAKEDSVKRIRVSEIRVRLIQGLEDWANVSDRIEGTNAHQLREIAELADDDPWRQRLRALRRSKNRAELERLAESSEAAAQPQDNVARLYDLLYDAGAHEAALAFLRKAQERNPADFWMNVDLADALLKNGSKERAAEAVGFIRAALVVQPQSPSLYLRLAAAFDNQGMTAEAEAARRKAIEINPSLGRSYFEIGNRLANQDKYSEAEAAYRKAIALRPDNKATQFNLGVVLNKQRKTEEAVIAFRKAIELDPKWAPPRNSVGHLLFEQGKLAEAESHLRMAVELDPDDPGGSAISLARIYSRLKKHPELVALCRERDKNVPVSIRHVRVAALCAEIADSDMFDSNELGQIRGKALTYIQRRLAKEKEQLATMWVKERLELESVMRGLLTDDDFKFVRGDSALAKLPEAERQEWRKVWEDVDELRKRLTPGNGFPQSWLILSELIAYEGNEGGKALDSQQISDEALLRPLLGERVEVNGKILVWKDHKSTEPYLDFRTVYGRPSEYRIAYAVCYVHADADYSDLSLCVGSDDQAKVYLNGKVVHRQAASRALEFDEDKIRPVTLRKGTNVLVFKVVNEGGSFGGCARFLTKDGDVPKGIEYRLTP